MKKTDGNYKSKKNANEKIEIHSFDDVFGKSKSKRAFKLAYSEEMTRLRIAQQIKALRDIKRMTQKAVALKTGMSQSVIARIESGERGLTIDTLGKIANALGKEVHLV